MGRTDRHGRKQHAHLHLPPRPNDPAFPSHLNPLTARASPHTRETPPTPTTNRLREGPAQAFSFVGVGVGPHGIALISECGTDHNGCTRRSLGCTGANARQPFAMQKVVGSSPIIRSSEAPLRRGFLSPEALAHAWRVADSQPLVSLRRHCGRARECESARRTLLVERARPRIAQALSLSGPC
jgi:hypothetical protein